MQEEIIEEKILEETIEIPQKENKMGTWPINKLLISMSAPMMISMLVQALYNIIDSIFVAHVSEHALTAVSLAFPIQNLMIAVGSGTGVGISALLSRSLGERNFARANKTANNAILLILVSAAVFAVFGLTSTGLFLRSQTHIGDVVAYGRDYLTICCSLSIVLFGQITFERLLQSTGNSFYSMITQTTGVVVNTILAPIFIFGYFGFPRLEVKGAALATVCGQTVAMLLALYFNIRKNQEIKLSLKALRPDFKIIKAIYAVGVPSIIMIAIGSIMTYGMNRILLAFTSTAAAVFGVYFRLQSIAFMPVFGLNNGLVPIVAFNYGAKNRNRMVQAIKLSIIYSVSIMVIVFAVMQIFPHGLLKLFNSTPDMFSIGIYTLRIISISFIFAGFSIITSGVFQSLGQGIRSLVVSVIRQLVILLPVAHFLAKTGSVNAVWWAFPIAEAVTLVVCVFFLRQVYVKKINRVGVE